MIWLVARALSSFGGGGGSQPPKVTYTIDQEVLRRSVQKAQLTLKEFNRLAREDLIKIMRQEMSIVAGRAAMMTPPLNGKGISAAQKNIEEDLNYIFRPLEEIPFGELVMAKQWPAVTSYNFNFRNKNLAKAYDDGNFDLIYQAFERRGNFEAYNEDITAVSAPTISQHKSARDKTGKLNGKRFFVTGSKDAAQSKINDAVKLAKAAIGKMAGGWVKCYKTLKGIGFSFPSEIQKNGHGATKTVWYGKELSVEIKNNFGNFGGYVDARSAMFGSALNEQAANGERRYTKNNEALLTRLQMK